MVAISVVIPAYNSHATLGAVLDSLLMQKAGLHEIIVADSSDDPAALTQLADYAARGVKVVALPVRTPPGLARNAGAAVATGELLAFVDSDAVPVPGWAARLAELHALGYRVGGGALRVPPSQSRLSIAQGQMFLEFNEFTDTGVLRAVRFAPSANLFCSRELFTELGGFPSLRASEDVLFGLKVSERQPFWFDPALVVEHLFRTSPRAMADNLRLLGEYVRHYRGDRAMGRFPFRSPWPAIIWPALITAKGLRICWRVLKTHRMDLWRGFLIGLPWFLAGLWYFGRGFAAGEHRKNSGG